MLKILWLNNVLIPKIAKDMNVEVQNYGGWLIKLSEELSNNKNIELNICFPQNVSKKIVYGSVDKIKYFGFPTSSKPIHKYNSNYELYFKEIIEKVKPDLVHIFGTEYPHTLSLIKAFNNSKRVLVNIQGLISFYTQHYNDGIPLKIQIGFTIRDFIRFDNLIIQKMKYKKRGVYEKKALSLVENIVGRTDWDYACSKYLNPNSNYYFCNENLRDTFYNFTWKLENCERNSIFVSQSNYPIKGFHFLIEAVTLLKKDYPNLQIYTTGKDLLNMSVFKMLSGFTSYERYIYKLIVDNNLRENFKFLGSLNETEMCKRFLSSNIFISPSSIENSSNSIGEAMILGVPTIASFVGGTCNVFDNKIDGFLYPHNEPILLAEYIRRILSNDDLALFFSNNSKEHAFGTHSLNNNNKCILEIYKKIMDNIK